MGSRYNEIAAAVFIDTSTDSIHQYHNPVSIRNLDSSCSTPQLLQSRVADASSSLNQQTSAAVSAAISSATVRMATRHEAELKAMRTRQQRQQHLQVARATLHSVCDDV